jgi:arginine decarboxylase-like protein
MSKYSIEVWNIQFYKVDDNGDALLNADGSVKLFDADIDVSGIADHVNDDDLVGATTNRPMNEWR